MNMPPTAEDYQHAVQILRQGGVIAYPTEAVFGLGCDPMNEKAVMRLLALKHRAVSKGLLLIGADYGQLLPFIDETKVPLTALARAQATWPGPITWVFPARATTPTWIRGHFQSIGIRHTAFAIASSLCAAFGGALVSTSANVEGQPPARTMADVKTLFNDHIDYILPGDVGSAQNPTEIRDILTQHVLRAGS
jgi:L-threonylcarbamoyladenylate synthase